MNQNLWFLDTDPVKAVQYMPDKELLTAFECAAGCLKPCFGVADKYVNDWNLAKNNVWSRWTVFCMDNVEWVLSYALEAIFEHMRRFHYDHPGRDYIYELMDNLDSTYVYHRVGHITMFPYATGDYWWEDVAAHAIHLQAAVREYRHHIITKDKDNTWSNRDQPPWWPHRVCRENHALATEGLRMHTLNKWGEYPQESALTHKTQTGEKDEKKTS